VVGVKAAGARRTPVETAPAARDATRTTVSTFGVLAGLAGLEHGVGEVLQGNVAPAGVVIESWPGSEAFRILAGEPAMTIVPNLLATGLLAIFVSLVFLVWVTMFVHMKHGGLVLILLSLVMLLFGAGFGPPMLGLVLGAAATRINAPSTMWSRLPDGARRLLADLWPWSFAAGVLAWLMVMPGTMIVDHFVGVDNPELVVPVITFSALGLLLLTILAGFARDARPTKGL
jgi:hypothetical protein